MSFPNGLGPLFAEVRNHFESGVVQAALHAGVDFATGQQRGWTYYAGVATGATVLATWGPLASLSVWVVGEAVDLHLLHGPEGGDFDLFIDGIAAGSFTTHAVNEVLQTVRVNLPGLAQAAKHVEFRTPNYDTSTGWRYVALAGLVPILRDWGFGWIIPLSWRPQPASAPIHEFYQTRTWRITYTIRDEKGQRGHFVVWRQDSLPLAAARGDGQDAPPIEYAIQLGMHLAQIISGCIVNISCSVSVPISMLQIIRLAQPGNYLLERAAVVPDVDSDVEEGAVIVCASRGRDQEIRVRVPTLREEFIEPSVHPLVTDFVNMLVGDVQYLGGASTQRGVPIAHVLRVEENFKRSRKVKR